MISGRGLHASSLAPLSTLLLSSWEQPPPTGLLAQRSAVWWLCFTIMGQIWVWSFILLKLRGAVAWSCLSVYLAYIWVGPGAAAARRAGGWPKWGQAWPLWALVRDYFSARLLRTAPLPAEGNYIFAVHPHGIAAISAYLTFCTQSTGFASLFPGASCAMCMEATWSAFPSGLPETMCLAARTCQLR